jgi:hypothetical protein
MKVWMRGAGSVIGLGLMAVALAACSSTARSNTADLNVVRAPQQLQPVQSSSVQQGTLPAIGATGTPAPGLSGTPVLGGAPAINTASATPGLGTNMTAKTGTNYYRASSPGCSVPQIASVTGWQQVGSQLQLYDDNGNIAAFLAPSGGRYIGTVSGGQAISMSR